MTQARRLRVLRIRRSANLLTAQAYEDLFDRQFATVFDVSFAPLEAWCEAVLGPPGTPLDLRAAAGRFALAIGDHDFFCPSYECIPLAPLLLAVRNHARSRARLLFIAHAAGMYSFEWTFLRPLLAAGDVIVAPSDSARRTIDYVCPELAPFVRMIPHPMERLARPTVGRAPARIATLGRIHAQKLTHRLIEAVAILGARGRRALHLDIGGPLDDGGLAGPHPYTRMLREKVRRLGIEDRVAFAGPIRGQRKNMFLAGADAVINLSVTTEESFPKTPVEALGMGVPVVGTDWNGLRDTVGGCGRLVPVTLSNDVLGGVDVEADHVADAIESLLDSPPPRERCIAWTEQFTPAVILPQYRAALDEGADAARDRAAIRDWPDADVSAAPNAGLLAQAPPLSVFSWRELFTVYGSWCDSVRHAWTGCSEMPLNEGARVRGVLMGGVESVLRLFFANLAPPALPAQNVECTPSRGVAKGAVDVLDRLERAALEPGLISGRAGCVRELIAAGRFPAAAKALDSLATAGLRPALVAFWRSELALAEDDAVGALARSPGLIWAHQLGESDWQLVRQTARAARRAGTPDVALPVLLAWLHRFPDSQESGPVWLDACVNSLRGGNQPIERAEQYHARARALLGDMPAVTKCGAAVMRARQAWACTA